MPLSFFTFSAACLFFKKRLSPCIFLGWEFVCLSKVVVLHCYYYFMDGQREYCHGETEALINWSAALLSLPMLVRIDFMSLKIGLCGTTLLLFSTSWSSFGCCSLLLFVLICIKLHLVLDGAQISIRFKKSCFKLLSSWPITLYEFDHNSLSLDSKENRTFEFLNDMIQL